MALAIIIEENQVQTVAAATLADLNQTVKDLQGQGWELNGLPMVMKESGHWRQQMEKPAPSPKTLQ